MTGILNIQISPTLANPDVNYNKIQHFIKKNSDKKLDLVVMPEYFSIGVDYDAFSQFAEDENGGKTIEFLQNLAKKYNTNIISGTIIEKSNEKLYNTSFAINRKGEIISKYRKIHLFNYFGGVEGDIITAGDQEVVVDFDFGKVGMATSFDIRFPQLFKNLTKKGAEMIVLPTAWFVPNEIYDDSEDLKYAQEMWIALNRTRAYDNGVYIITSNQCGKINQNIGSVGNSLVISPTAQVLANAKEKQCAVYADVDLSVVKYLKSVFPVAEID